MKNVIILSILILCLVITVFFSKKFNPLKTVINYSVNTPEYIGYKTSGYGYNNSYIYTKEEYDKLDITGDIVVRW